MSAAELPTVDRSGIVELSLLLAEESSTILLPSPCPIRPSRIATELEPPRLRALVPSALVSVVEPQPNPETVEALLDTTWRMVASEAARTDALDRNASTVATFASLVATLTATLGLRFVEQFNTWWALTLFVAGLGALVFSVVAAVVALFRGSTCRSGSRISSVFRRGLRSVRRLHRFEVKP